MRQHRFQRTASNASAVTLTHLFVGGGASTGRTTAPPQTKVYVGNVEPHITTEMIKTIFQPFGMVVGAEMVVDPTNPGHVRDKPDVVERKYIYIMKERVFVF